MLPKVASIPKRLTVFTTVKLARIIAIAIQAMRPALPKIFLAATTHPKVKTISRKKSSSFMGFTP